MSFDPSVTQLGASLVRSREEAKEAMTRQEHFPHPVPAPSSLLDVAEVRRLQSKYQHELDERYAAQERAWRDAWRTLIRVRLSAPANWTFENPAGQSYRCPFYEQHLMDRGGCGPVRAETFMAFAAGINNGTLATGFRAVFYPEKNGSASAQDVARVDVLWS